MTAQSLSPSSSNAYLQSQIRDGLHTLFPFENFQMTEGDVSSTNILELKLTNLSCGELRIAVELSSGLDPFAIFDEYAPDIVIRDSQIASLKIVCEAAKRSSSRRALLQRLGEVGSIAYRCGSEVILNAMPGSVAERLWNRALVIQNDAERARYEIQPSLVIPICRNASESKTAAAEATLRLST